MTTTFKFLSRPQLSYLRRCQSSYHYLSLASYHPLSPPLLPAVSSPCYHHTILHLPCQLKINSTPDPSLSPCVLTSEGQYLAILNSLSSISLTNSTNDVKTHTHIHTQALLSQPWKCSIWRPTAGELHHVVWTERKSRDWVQALESYLGGVCFCNGP